MAQEVYWVRPSNPHLIWEKPDILLQPSDLIPDWMDFVWVFPGPLDIPRLRNALAKTLYEFYHAAGRVRFNAELGKWNISFAENDGIPLTVGMTALPGVMSPDFDHQKHQDFVDEHPYMLIPDPEKEMKRPFVTLKVVTSTSTGETTLTLGWCHLCGDCTSMCHMMMSLSLYYQGIQPTFEPTFDKYHQPDPTLDDGLIPQVLPLLYHQEHAIDTSIVFKSLQMMMLSTSRVAVHLTAKEIRSIHAWVAKHTTVSCVSETDAVIGFLSACIAAVSPSPVKKIAYILGTRSMCPEPVNGFILPAMTSMGNCMQTITTEEVAPEPTPWNFAAAMRTSIIHARNPENLRRILALHSQMLQRPNLVPDYLNLVSPDNMVFVNALNKIPVLQAHFGYAGQTRFYLYGSAEHFVSMLPANPQKNESNGRWTTNTGGVDIVFRLKPDRVDGFWVKFKEMMLQAELKFSSVGFVQCLVLQ